MDVLLVAATVLEMRAALSGLAEVEPEPALLSGPVFPLPVLTIGPLRLHLLVCGVGPVSAAAALGASLAAGPSPRNPQHSPKGASRFCLVLNLGLAGSYDLEQAPLGCLVRATEEVWPEYGLATGETVLAQGMPFAQAELSTGPVFQRIGLWPENTLGKLRLTCHTQSSARRGISVTVAGVSGTLEQARRMQACTGGLVENMEGFALALCTAVYAEAQKGDALPFVELRAVSNQAGLRPPHGWNIPAALSALAGACGDIFTRNALPSAGQPLLSD